MDTESLEPYDLEADTPFLYVVGEDRIIPTGMEHCAEHGCALSYG
jgi:hypothetical protein